jgi:AcrR family transcriptional regulator
VIPTPARKSTAAQTNVRTKARQTHKAEPAATADESADGRRLRAERNRDSVVSAVLDIIREQGGGPVPGASEVAQRASVSERTVFRHFADLDSLFLAAAAQQRPIFVSYLGPRPDAKAFDDRLAALVKLRSKLWEEIAPVRRVAVHIASHQKTLADQIGESAKAARDQVAAVFAPELAKAGKDKGNLLDQLDLLLSWAVWDALRTGQGASADRARKVITELITNTVGRPKR